MTHFMNILREVVGGVRKMFAGDLWLTIGVLIVVSLTALLTVFIVVPSLLRGVILLLGCVVVLEASVVIYGWRHRNGNG